MCSDEHNEKQIGRVNEKTVSFSERQGERVTDTYSEMIELPKDVKQRAFTQNVCGLVSRYHDMSGGVSAALETSERLASRPEICK